MMPSTNSFSILEQQLTEQANNMDTPSGIWADIGVPKCGALLFASLNNGFDYSTVDALAMYGVNRKELSAVTGITLSTLDRRKAEGHLNTQESDKVYGLVRLIDAAMDLFSDNKEQADTWIRQRTKGLGGRAPIEMIRTSAETESVIDYIGRIKHGITV